MKRLTAVGVHHITLNVTDLDRARAFYEGVLGFEVDQWREGRKCRLRLGGEPNAPKLVLRPPHDETATGDRFAEHRIGLDHLAIEVEERSMLDDAVDRLQRAGVPTSGVKDEGTYALLCFRDPDNIQLELWWNP